jgi:hypothetical protein
LGGADPRQHRRPRPEAGREQRARPGAARGEPSTAPEGHGRRVGRRTGAGVTPHAHAPGRAPAERTPDVAPGGRGRGAGAGDEERSGAHPVGAAGGIQALTGTERARVL